MDSVDLEVLKHSVRWLDEGRRVLLVTVVQTWGSSPRPEGAMLAVRDDGHVVGSVSGGCIEDDLIERVRARGIEQSAPEAVKYGVTAEEAHRFGLPCGGTIELVLEPLSARSGIADLYEAVQAGRLVVRTLDMASGAARLGDAHVTDGLHFDGKSLATVHGPRYRMLVIGAGQLSRYLCGMAVGLDYHVTVCDPREEYTDEWNVPGTTVVRTMPDDTVMDMHLDERCAVIALTHDPKLDDLALMEALKTPAFYVGALGSRRNNAARRERLKEFDLTDTEIARLHGPVGIFIGSRTPPEIAVSILAEVTAAKNGISLPELLQVEGAKAARESERSGSHGRVEAATVGSPAAAMTPGAGGHACGV
ncbi:XdhC family protein [Chitinasiproducens palmae]|uniref:Predicted sulfurylase large subunit, molybdopterin cytosine dinucleotide biosynthesis /predicted sulfurylase small subunit, molybdopterin cytosine dinucleotide biosynthesis n=1 Tax=Chitinasiproducens palmae TaxID=1770053 RepID=A0A1H2PRU2_9BURK|nr:XdhC family protein [Chitinasiproducens palmae]SDV48838.1 predicted sulfurylase large subunit, molybdopterin cytosine dinucleotide biosynthesis /predicted sulfurylase small subunit, molybdopterin cytosine dinucleotide biosynthesis [Chitinasiproducens palmae]